LYFVWRRRTNWGVLMPVNFCQRVGIVVAAALGWVAFQGVAPANANTITFELDSVFGGATPHGSLPWVTAIFTDKGPNTVRLTLAASGLSRREFLGKRGFLFNLDPFPGHLKAKYIRGQKGKFTFRRDRFKPLGQGPFDALLSFSGDQSLRPGERSVWRITGKGLSTAEILDLGEGSGLDVASLVQGIPLGKHKRGSGWITDDDAAFEPGKPIITTNPPDVPPPVPLPATLWAFGSGLGGLLLLSRRRRASKSASLEPPIGDQEASRLYAALG